MERKRRTFDTQMLDRLLRELDGEPLDPALEAEIEEIAAWAEANPPSDAVWESLRARILVATAKRIEDPEGEHEPVLVGRFELDDVLGEGGMGVVFLAWDTHLERNVALKLWKSKRPGVREALEAEAKTLAQLNHPNVVTIHEAGSFEDHVYFVMEYVEGVDVGTWIRAKDPDLPPLNWLTVVEVFAAAGRGLAAAHDAHFMHNDLKPANILIGIDHRVKVADFGLAELIYGLREDDEERYRPGTVVYMAPERLAGRRGDTRSDQYAFCASMYRVLYGAPPYAGESRPKLRESIEAGELQVGKQVLPGIPGRLRSVVLKGLAREPEERHEDMHTLARALADIPESIKRRKWVAVFSALIALCSTLAVVAVVMALRPSIVVVSPVEPIASQDSQLDPPAPTSSAPVSLGDVYEEIDRGEPEAAVKAWRSWRNEQRGHQQPTLRQTLEIGEKLFAAARRHAATDPDLAVRYAQHAEHVAIAARKDLPDATDLSEVDVARIQTAATKLENNAETFWRTYERTGEFPPPAE